ncbi:MAG: hypothetical protein IJ753_07240 [Bacteroidales bacterium]|nr:hypothetical protein [Bacteroidales bacterium]MBQ9701792.1 hypothetical protein [Bacteroidales bacterium]MBR1783290.1 hypothetical protein [Bacteroidales bacterium]
MNIDLLAKMVKEVVMDHDVVTLPGVGSFVAEWVPSTFADRGYTILPPYRKLYFSPKQGDDTLLAQLYARSNDISEADATRILIDFLTEMKEVLKVKKTIIFPGLGRLRATMENHFFFVADEDLDIYPAGFGLQPLSLKTHEETQEEVAEAVASLATLLQKEPEVSPEPEPEPEAVIPGPDPVIPGPDRESPEMADQVGHDEDPVGHDEEPEPELKPKDKKKKKSGWGAFWTIMLVLLVLALVAAIALVVAGQFAPEWLDSLLYTPEEYEFLHNQ